MAITFKNPEALREWTVKTKGATVGMLEQKGNLLSHSITLATALDRLVDQGIISRSSLNQIKKYKGANEGNSAAEQHLIEIIEMLDDIFSASDGNESPEDVVADVSGHEPTDEEEEEAEDEFEEDMPENYDPDEEEEPQEDME